MINFYIISFVQNNIFDEQGDRSEEEEKEEDGNAGLSSSKKKQKTAPQDCTLMYDYCILNAVCDSILNAVALQIDCILNAVGLHSYLLQYNCEIAMKPGYNRDTGATKPG